MYVSIGLIFVSPRREVLISKRKVKYSSIGSNQGVGRSVLWSHKSMNVVNR